MGATKTRSSKQPGGKPSLLNQRRRNPNQRRRNPRLLKQLGGDPSLLKQRRGKPSLLTDRYLDDNNVEYRDRVTKKLKPNMKYTLNGYNYATDDKGRIISAEGLLILEKEKRHMEDVKKIPDLGYIDGIDHRGHLIGHQFKGSDTLGNFFPQDGKLNIGDYKTLEMTLAAAIEDGKEVFLMVEPIYKDSSMRPSQLKVTYVIDKDQEVIIFDNDNYRENSIHNEIKHRLLELRTEKHKKKRGRAVSGDIQSDDQIVEELKSRVFRGQPNTEDLLRFNRILYYAMDFVKKFGEYIQSIGVQLNLEDFVRLKKIIVDAKVFGANLTVDGVEPIINIITNKPYKIKVSYTIDGEKEVIVFNNESGV